MSEENKTELLAKFQGSEEALEAVKAVLLAYSQEEVRQFTMSVPEAVASTIRIWQSYLEDKDDIMTSFTQKGFNPDEVANLPQRVSALWQAEIMLNQAIDPETRLHAVLAVAKLLHVKLAKAAKYVFEDDDKIWPVVKEIRKGSGHMDRAGDLARYAELLTTYWSMVENNCNVSKEDLGQAKELSTQILSAYTDAKGTNVDNLKDIRDRAAEYLKRGVEDIRDAAAYHYRKTPEAMDRYPSLFKFRKSSKKADDIALEELEKELSTEMETAVSEVSNG